MRLTLLPSLLVCGLLLVAVSSARADRIEATNSDAVEVLGISRPNLPPVVRSVNFTGAELDFGSGIVLDVDITIDFSKLSIPMPPFPDQPWYNEIGFALKSPGGTLVELIPINTFLSPTQVPFLFNNTPGFTGVITLDDAAANLVNDGPIADRPNAGTFRPMSPLSAFNGENALGTWELWIEDENGDHPVQFHSFTLSIQTAPAVVPEPGSVVLGGISLLALAGFAWRRRNLKSQKPNHKQISNNKQEKD